MLEVRLLGQFVVFLDGASVQINSRPAQSLLAYLLINAGKAFRREKLAGLLWPDTSDANARNNLRQALWRIRKSLEKDSPTPQLYFLVDDLKVGFNAESDYSLDVNKLEAKVDDSISLPKLIETVSLYTGELLPGFYDDWIVLERERLQSAYETQMDLLIHRLIENQNWPMAIEWSERWIASGSVPEPAYRSLMIAHAGRGDLSRMATAYHRCEKAMLNELGLEPSESTRSLFDSLKIGNKVIPELARDMEVKQVSPQLDEAPAPGESPYKGLQFYDESDADYFFGREQLTGEIYKDLIEGKSFTALVGASGSGKSSVVRAGLIPVLKSGKPHDSDTSATPHEKSDWKVILTTPTAHPLEALAIGLKKESQDGILMADFVKEMTHKPQGLRDHLSKWLSENKTKTKTTHRLLIVVDQFEELFTLCQDEVERSAFIDNLLNTTNPQAEVSISVVITLRADFYAHCGQYPELRSALTKNQIYLGPMNAEEIRRVIEGPARQGGWEFESGLVELILRDVSKEPGALPLLSHALLETWGKRRGRTLTLQGYATSGGVRGGIARTAESVFNLQLSPVQQLIAKNIFLRLTNLGEETEGTRRRVDREELYPATQNASTVHDVLGVLAEARLITVDADSVEVAHEALITEWPTLRDWLVENREGLRLHRHFTEAAQAWDELDRNPGELYRGARLSQALEWAEDHQPSLSLLEQEFLTASKERAEQAENERKAQQERELAAALELAQAQEERAEAEKELAESQTQAVAQLRRRAVYLMVALIFVIAMAGVALYLGDRVRQVAITAQANAERAEEESHIAFSRELAAAALSNLDLDPERSILLALHAVSEAQSADLPVPREAEEALHRTVLTSRLRMSMESGFSVDFSPDGSLVAYSGPDSTAIIQEFPSGRGKLVLSGHSRDLYGVSVHFSSDGKRLITTSADKTSKVWDVSTGEELLTLQGHTETLTDGIINSTGTLIATTGNDGTARIWDANTGEELLRIDLPEPAGIAFNPEGKYLAVADISLFGGSIEIWDVISGRKMLTLAGHDQGTNDVAFNSDGTQLVSVGQDQKIKLWDLNSGDEILTLVDDAPFYTLAISPDGSQIATGGRDGLAKVWDVESGEILLTLTGHTDVVSFVAFSPDSKFLATSSFDGTTRIWDISPEGISEWLTVAGHSRVVLSADYSPDGRKFATASWDQTAIIWDAFNGEKLLSLKDFEGALGSIEFSPDQTQLVTSDYSGAVKVWNADTGKLHLSFLAHDTPGDIDADFSPDGKTIGSGGSDGVARLWDAETGQLIGSFKGHTDVINRVAFSPDGNLFATASWDGTAKVWEVSSGQLLSTLGVDAGQVRSVDFNPDGKLLATAHEDGTATIWNVSTESELQEDERLLYRLVGHSNTIFEAVFNPDGRRLATSGFDGTIRIWDVDSGRELLVLAENTGGPDMDFSPDGRFLVLAGGDGTARVFVLSVNDLKDLAKSRLTRSLTLEECQKYLHQDTCLEQ